MTMITPSYLGETIEYSSLHACRSTLEDPTPGEVGASDADEDVKARAQVAAMEAVAGPLEVYQRFFLDGRTFIGGDSPSIADIRLAATLEFLRSIDYELPAWVEDYFEAMEGALGDAYTEPAADVRGYVQSVKQPEIAPS